jgi:HK97 family phage major capsid protein/HK97 family phage prohead protease
MPDVERRTGTLSEARVEGRTLYGYAAVFNTLSVPLQPGGFRERLAPGCFTADALAGDVRLVVDHRDRILGRTASGTLRLRQDDHGLYFEADLPDTSYARDLSESIRRGDVDSCSFAFNVDEGGERWDGDVREVRAISRLHDLTIATGAPPAYPGTSVGVRTTDHDNEEGDMPDERAATAPTNEAGASENENQQREAEAPEAPEQPSGGLQVEQRTAAPASTTSTHRPTPVLTPEQRMVDWQNARPSRSSFTHDDAAQFSLGRAVRGMVLGDWRDAEIERRALSEGTNSAGGFLTPEPLSAQTIDRIRNQARVFQAGATTVPMDSDTLSIPRMTTGVTPAWRAENAAVAENDPAFERVTFTARSLAILVRLSYELFEDMPSQSADLITNELTQALALELDRAALRGTGVAPQPEGIRNQDNVTLQPVGGANGAAPTNYSDLIAAVAALEGRNVTPNAAIWNPRTAATYAGFTDTTEQPLVPPPYLSGVTYLSSNQVPINLTTGTSTDTTEVYLGRWSDLLIGLRPSIGIRVQQLNERFADNMQIGLLAYLRADVQLRYPAAFQVLTGVRP